MYIYTIYTIYTIYITGTICVCVCVCVRVRVCVYEAPNASASRIHSQKALHSAFI